MTAADRLAELGALADAATPGPWVVQDGDEVHAPHLLDQEEASDVATIFDADADAAFIAAARSAVPALIAALKAVLRELPGGTGDPYTSGEYDSGWDAGRFDLAVKIRAAIESALGATS
jgi:hypothetical protein